MVENKLWILLTKRNMSADISGKKRKSHLIIFVLLISSSSMLTHGEYLIMKMFQIKFKVIFSSSQHFFKNGDSTLNDCCVTKNYKDAWACRFSFGGRSWIYEFQPPVQPVYDAWTNLFTQHAVCMTEARKINTKPQHRGREWKRDPHDCSRVVP